MCGGGGGGGGGGVSNNRPVTAPTPLTIDRNPSFNTPERPKLDLHSEDSFEGARAPKRAKKKERSVIDRAVDSVKEALPKIGDFIKDKIGRNPVTEAPPIEVAPAPVVPR